MPARIAATGKTPGRRSRERKGPRREQPVDKPFACLTYHLTGVVLVLQLHAEPQEAYDTHLHLFDYEPQA
jgi:hypothetical protein